jgi:ligand-binding SRPBCC domain-containing protein
MKIYTIKRTEVLPVSIGEAWDFFSNPVNLSKITPPGLNLRITYNSGSDNMYAGQLIRYRIKVLPLITSDWLTEITHVVYHRYFIDEQRYGPYSLWHHRHHFEQAGHEVIMTDEVNYAIPLGIIGRFANSVFVGRMVNAIFDHRSQAIQNIFRC